MRPVFRFIVAVVVTACAIGCQTGSKSSTPPELSARQREAMQTRILDSEYDQVYGAVISILQDEGWRLEQVDKDSGVIQAASLKYQDNVGPREDHLRGDKKFQKYLEQQIKHGNPPVWTRWRELTARVEPWGDGRTRVRVTIVKLGSISPIDA